MSKLSETDALLSRFIPINRKILRTPSIYMILKSLCFFSAIVWVNVHVYCKRALSYQALLNRIFTL